MESVKKFAPWALVAIFAYMAYKWHKKYTEEKEKAKGDSFMDPALLSEATSDNTGVFNT